jgi:hypothetical protein
LKNYVLSGIVAAALIASFIAAPYYSLNNLLVQAQAPPAAAGADITLEGMSTEGSIVVTVNWTPADIGQPNTFSFIFTDPEGNLISPIYSIELLKGNNQTMPGTLRQEQTSSVQEYTFNQTGSYTLRIHDVQSEQYAAGVIDIPLQVPLESPPTTTNSTSSNTTTTTSNNNPDMQFEEILGSGLSDDTRGEY